MVKVLDFFLTEVKFGRPELPLFSEQARLNHCFREYLVHASVRHVFSFFISGVPPLETKQLQIITEY